MEVKRKVLLLLKLLFLFLFLFGFTAREYIFYHKSAWAQADTPTNTPTPSCDILSRGCGLNGCLVTEMATRYYCPDGSTYLTCVPDSSCGEGRGEFPFPTFPTQPPANLTPTISGGEFPSPTFPTKPPATLTSTINLMCVFSNNRCDSSCVFSKQPGANYPNPLSCSLSSSLFSAVPTQDDKNNWCRRSERTKGDADGNGVVEMLDYYYYVGVVNGGKIPANVNPDFNGDGEVGRADREIVIKTLNPVTPTPTVIPTLTIIPTGTKTIPTGTSKE